jgi:hypothetical protein
LLPLVAVFLAATDSGCVNGQVVVDGGQAASMTGWGVRADDAAHTPATPHIVAAPVWSADSMSFGSVGAISLIGL